MEQDFESRKEAIQRADEELLATLGYKQEFKRAFKPIEVCYPSTELNTQPTYIRRCTGFRYRLLHHRLAPIHRLSPILCSP